MARGRMISKSLSTSECFAQLFEVCPSLAEFCQSLYPLLVSHSDDFGREQGDVFTVKHAVHPTSPRTPDEFALALDALRQVGLIEWYVVKDREYIAIVKFEDHQSGLHRRTKSAFPPPNGISRKVREQDDSGKFREIPGQLNGRELKGTEGKRTEPEQERAPSAPTRALLTLFDELHTAKFGAKADIKPGKDAKLLADLWRQRQGDPVTVEALMAAFFASSDPFMRQAGWSVGVFVSQIGKLLPKVARETMAAIDWFEECKTLHSGACEGRYAHETKMRVAS